MFKRKVFINLFLIILLSFIFSTFSLANEINDNELDNKKASNQIVKPTIKYSGHVEKLNWQNYVDNGKTCGTTGKCLRMEALKINLLQGSNTNIKLQYRAHVQGIGWQNWVNNDEISGTTGKSLRMEAIQIKIDNSYDYSIMYRAHVQGIGWQDWVSDGEIAGTTGKCLRMEAIQIKIVPKINKGTMYIETPANNSNYLKGNNTVFVSGWKMANVKNTKVVAYVDSSTVPIDEKLIQYYERKDVIKAITNYGTQIENPNPGFSFNLDISNFNNGIHSIRVNLITSNNEVIISKVVNFIVDRDIHVKYRAHVESIGWQNYIQDGNVSGTTGRCLRMEGMNIELINAPSNANIICQAHVEKIGWQDWVKNGSLVGTTGKYLRMEAIKIKLENMPGYSIEYQAHIQGIGWSDWVSNGEIAGTFGKCLRLEAIRIRLVSANKKTTVYGIDVSQHQKTIDWNKVKNSGQVDFAILRCGYGKDIKSQDDTQFLRNMSECERLGIPYGVYIYSYSLVTKDASGVNADPYSEANHVLRLIKGHNPNYGIWFDMENDTYKERYGMPSDNTLVEICNIFCEQIKKAGYNVGIYSNLDWLNTKLNNIKITQNDIWVAHWASKCEYTKPYKIWQFSNAGYIPGIEGKVDLDVIYK